MKSILNSKKKGQLQIGDAPGVVMIVLFLFMILGTSAYILEKYGESFGSDETASIVNETYAQSDLGSIPVDSYYLCNFDNFVVTAIWNDSDILIDSGNYTYNSSGIIMNITGEFDTTNGTTDGWNVSYAYTWGGSACDVNEDLLGEVEDNVSIAGMILTIALIGIVLSILIGLFYVFTGGRTKPGM